MLEKREVQENQQWVVDTAISMMVVLTMVDGMVIIQMDNQYNVIEIHV